MMTLATSHRTLPRHWPHSPKSPATSRAPFSRRRCATSTACWRDGWTRAGMRRRTSMPPATCAASIRRHRNAPRLVIGSHLDTVPHAGAFDGILGVVIGVALVEALAGARLPFAIEVIGFSEEEGVRFGVPFIGSRALAGTLDDDCWPPDAPAIRRTPFASSDSIPAASAAPRASARATIRRIPGVPHRAGAGAGSLDLPLGVVEAIVGQSRCEVDVSGQGQPCRHHAHEPAPRRAGRRRGVDRRRRSARARARLAWSPRSAHLQVEPGAANVIAGRSRSEPRCPPRR